MLTKSLSLIPQLESKIKDELLTYDPSFLGDLISNMNVYEHREINTSWILVRDSCFESLLEKEYLNMEQKNFYDKEKI